MSSNPSQLFLLADHIKLSLLERQRAIALNLEPTKQDGHITRSLESLRDGIENLRKQQRQLSSTGTSTKDLQEQTVKLQKQYAEMNVAFYGSSGAIVSEAITEPNDPALAGDFARAKRTPKGAAAAAKSGNKSVRFRDNPDDEERSYHDDDDEENRTALFSSSGSAATTAGSGRYTDDTSADLDQSALSNQQIHAHHKQVLREQDDQLDTLGESIRRQRHLGVQMGNELDEQVELLDDVEAGVGRHQGTLDRAQTRLKGVARKAKDNWSWITIACLILILVLLIALT
ncbi:hypothetical protein AAFC00_006811 [Neodothiora populina]|uniref:t-SNARE coiled-coil homology domain-containing protein n=1 Tax=Neodothiora populina TaxID=2781224 RepID=A0ABR3PBE0_9PEZI